jgi:hypothetical protein
VFGTGVLVVTIVPLVSVLPLTTVDGTANHFAPLHPTMVSLERAEPVRVATSLVAVQAMVKLIALVPFISQYSTGLTAVMAVRGLEVSSELVEKGAPVGSGFVNPPVRSETTAMLGLARKYATSI